MTIVSMIVIALLFFGVSRLLFPKTISGQTESSEPSVTIFPERGVEKKNDKLVLIKNAVYDEVADAIIGCCREYNGNGSDILPRLIKLSDSECAVIFPYDIDFEAYCNFVNFLYYPVDMDYEAEILAWTSTKPTDKWITELSAGKTVMLFIPKDDDEYDNVYLTTSSNIGYRLGFGVGKEKQLLPQPSKNFITPPFTLSELQGKPFEDFQ